MNKFLVLLFIFLIVTACGTPQKNQGTSIHPNYNISQFEMDLNTCKKVGFDTAGPRPTFETVPSCRGGGSACANTYHRIYVSNRRLHDAWVSDFLSGYKPCMLDKGYELKKPQ